jgi:hypothetical protein
MPEEYDTVKYARELCASGKDGFDSLTHSCLDYIDALRAFATEQCERAEKVEKMYQSHCILGVGDGSGQLFVSGTYESVKECQRKLLALETEHAARVAAEEDVRRLDWCETKWTDGLHVETCGASPGGNAEPRKTATVFVGKNEHKAHTIRAAIDAAKGATK